MHHKLRGHLQSRHEPDRLYRRPTDLIVSHQSINPTPASAIVHIVFFRYMIRSTAILVVLRFSARTSDPCHADRTRHRCDPESALESRAPGDSRLAENARRAFPRADAAVRPRRLRRADRRALRAVAIDRLRAPRDAAARGARDVHTDRSVGVLPAQRGRHRGVSRRRTPRTLTLRTGRRTRSEATASRPS